MTVARKTREQFRQELRARGEEVREVTATERLAALNERRSAGNGYLIAPPEPLTAESFRGWLRSVSEVGSPGDVEIAWHRCENAILKGHLNNEYDALRCAAGARYHALERQAEREQHVEHAVAVKRSEQTRIEREIAQYKAAIAALEKKL
jgi:hypothetical protein